jgi:hypothetical protein
MASRIAQDRLTRENIREAPISEQSDEIISTAERFAASMNQQFDTQFDFSVESLVRLDGWLDEWIDMAEAYAGDRREEIVPIAFSVAAYAGEVIRRSLEDVTWITEAQEGEMPPPHLLIQNKVRVNLMKKSIQYLTRTERPSFAGYYQTVAELANENASEREC